VTRIDTVTGCPVVNRFVLLEDGFSNNSNTGPANITHSPISCHLFKAPLHSNKDSFVSYMTTLPVSSLYSVRMWTDGCDDDEFKRIWKEAVVV
jgi:hypothetical protein